MDIDTINNYNNMMNNRNVIYTNNTTNIYMMNSYNNTMNNKNVTNTKNTIKTSNTINTKTPRMQWCL